MRGKNALIVGTGEGASDVVNCASKTAKKVTMWSHRYLDCAPRFIFLFLSDAWYDENDYMDLYHKQNGALESVTTSRVTLNLPLVILALGLHGLTSDTMKKHGAHSVHAMSYAFLSRLLKGDYYSADTSVVPTKSAKLMTIASKGLRDILISTDVKVIGKTLTFRDAEVFGAFGNGIRAEPNYQAPLRLMPMSLWPAPVSVWALTGSPCLTTVKH